MRIGITLGTAEPTEALRGLVDSVESLGLDAVLLAARPGVDGLVAAASLAQASARLTVLVEVDLGEHPLHLAEKIAVADNCLGGRMGVVLRGDDAEAARLVAGALRSRPVRGRGPRWPVPARLPENDDTTWTAVRVTPGPAQLLIPILVADAGVASETGLPLFGAVSESAASLDDRWSSLEKSNGPGMQWALRAAARSWSDDPAETVSDLHACRDSFGLELAFLSRNERWEEHDLLTARDYVWPRCQLDELPEGLTEFWSTTLGAR